MTVMKRETREQARQLRTQGISVIQIAEQLGVSKGSVSVWVRDIELTPSQIENLKKSNHRQAGQLIGAKANQQKALEKRKKWQEFGRIKAREGNLLHMKGCMLYWAEGAKNRNSVIFVNSDPDMMLAFIQFLRQALNVDDDIMKLQIHCHTHDEIERERIGRYWVDLLGLKPTNLRNIQTKKGSDTRKNILHNGVCALTVHSTELAMHIYGAIQEYGGFERPEWLF